MRPRWRSWLKLRRPPATAGAAGRAADLQLASIRLGEIDQTEREEIRRLAEDIVEAQTREIEQLREWRAAWY